MLIITPPAQLAPPPRPQPGVRLPAALAVGERRRGTPASAVSAPTNRAGRRGRAAAHRPRAARPARCRVGCAAVPPLAWSPAAPRPTTPTASAPATQAHIGGSRTPPGG